MTRQSPLVQMILSALFLAMGVALPQAFHAVGLGQTFLPMHLPVLLCGFFISWEYAFTVGLLTPILGCLITGMPPLFPTLCIMAPELAAYGVLSSLAFRSWRLNVHFSLMIAMIGGRLVCGGAVWVLTYFFAAKLPSVWMYLTAAVGKGLPGIAIQLALIPLLVVGVNRRARGRA